MYFYFLNTDTQVNAKTCKLFYCAHSLSHMNSASTIWDGFSEVHLKKKVPTNSPSRGGDVTVYVFNVNQPSLPIPFTLFLCLYLSLLPFQLYFTP